MASSTAYAKEDATAVKGTTRIRLALFFPEKGTLGNLIGLSDPKNAGFEDFAVLIIPGN